MVLLLMYKINCTILILQILILQVSIFQLQSETASLFVSWSGDVTVPPPGGQDEDFVELNGLLANKSGFVHGEKVCLELMNSFLIFVSMITN